MKTQNFFMCFSLSVQTTSWTRELLLNSLHCLPAVNPKSLKCVHTTKIQHFVSLWLRRRDLFTNFKFNKFNRNGFIFFIRSERNGTHQLVINEIKLHKLPRATQQNIYIVTNIYIFLSQDDYEQQQDGDDVVVDIFMSTQSPP